MFNIYHQTFGLIASYQNDDPSLVRMCTMPVLEMVIGTTLIEVTRDVYRIGDENPMHCFTVGVHILVDQPWLTVGDDFKFADDLPSEHRVYSSREEVTQYLGELQSTLLSAHKVWTDKFPWE